MTYVIDSKAMEKGTITGTLYYNEFYCTLVGDNKADFTEFNGFFVSDCNAEWGWDYAKVLSSEPDGSPASIEGVDGTELVFYEEDAFYTKEDYGEITNLYLLPYGQTPQEYTDIITWSVDMNKFMETGKFAGYMSDQDGVACWVTADMDKDFYVKGLFIEKCNVDVDWTYSKIASRDD